MHEDFIRKAIEAAHKSVQEGGIPIGAVMVKDGAVIAEGISSVWTPPNPSGHAESNCIRNASLKLETINLEGCVLYGTLEPCGMCLSCAAWANLPQMYFGAYRTDVLGNDYELNNWSAEETAQKTHLFNGAAIQVTGGILREECAALLKDYQNWQKK